MLCVGGGGWTAINHHISGDDLWDRSVPFGIPQIPPPSPQNFSHNLCFVRSDQINRGIARLSAIGICMHFILETLADNRSGQPPPPPERAFLRRQIGVTNIRFAKIDDADQR